MCSKWHDILPYLSARRDERNLVAFPGRATHKAAARSADLRRIIAPRYELVNPTPLHPHRRSRAPSPAVPALPLSSFPRKRESRAGVGMGVPPPPAQKSWGPPPCGGGPSLALRGKPRGYGMITPSTVE